MISDSHPPLSGKNGLENNRFTNQPSVKENKETVNASQTETKVEDKEAVALSVAEIQKAEKTLQVKEESKDSKVLLEAIETVSAFMNKPVKNVNFLIDDSSGKTFIRVVDAKNDDLIKQFPSEKVIEMSGKIKGLQQEIGEKTGMLIDSKV